MRPLYHDSARLFKNESKSRATGRFDDKADISIHHLQETLPRRCAAWLSILTRKDLVNDKEAFRGDGVDPARLDWIGGDDLRADSSLVHCYISCGGPSGLLFEPWQGCSECRAAVLPILALCPVRQYWSAICQLLLDLFVVPSHNAVPLFATLYEVAWWRLMLQFA